MPLFGKDRTLFKLFGLPIQANASWLLLVALVVVSLGRDYFPSKLPRDVEWFVPWGLAAVGALALFASLLLHELCHSLVARAMGMPVSGITLFIFGGVSKLEDEPPTPLAEFFMAVAGPAASVMLGFGFFGLWLLGFAREWPRGLLALLAYLSFINFLLAAFNSLPAFPLDGGRVLRSLLWAVVRDVRTATQVAVRIGSAFGFGLMALGFFSVLSSFASGSGIRVTAIWPIVMGFFLRQAAQGSLQMVIIREHLQGETVRRLMTTDVVTVRHDVSVEDFVGLFVFRFRFRHYPVVDEYGRLIGMVDARAPRMVDSAHWPTTTVGSLAQPVDPGAIVSPDLDGLKALAALRAQGGRRLVVVADGAPVGIVTLGDLMTFLSLKSALRARRR